MSDKLVNIEVLNDLVKKLDKRNNDNIAIISEKINAIEEFVNDAIDNIPEGFSGDYNDLDNRPCYDDIKSIEYTYDGNATGRVVATDPFEAMVKVSDEVIDYETYLKSVVGIHYPDGIQYHNISDKIEGEDYYLTKSKDMIWGGNVTVVYEDNVELWGAVFPEKGIYFHDASLLIGYDDPSYTCSFIAEIGGELKQLDEKFIPESIATKEYVDNSIAEIVNSAPETLNTLNELAQALGDDPNFATTMATEIGKKADKNDLFSKDYNDLTNKPEIPSIEGLATEEYVDNTYLPLTGGLVTGNVQIDGNLVNNNNATFNKQVTFNDIATLGAGANLAGNEVQINADALVNNSPSTHNQAATFNEDVIFNKNVTFGEDAVLSGNKVQIDANTLVNNAVSTHNQDATFNGETTFNSPTTLGAGANLAGNEVQINADALVNNSPSTHNQAATFNGDVTFNSPTTLGAGANLAGNKVQIDANTLVNNAVSTHNQAATFNNTVIFNEQATFSKDLNVAGNVNVTAETGDAWFNGNVSVGADNKQLATEEFVNTMLGGLRLIQMTQSEYDALEVKDSNTLYIII